MPCAASKGRTFVRHQTTVDRGRERGGMTPPGKLPATIPPGALALPPATHLVPVVLDAPEWRELLDAIPTDTVRDPRDRAPIATLTYSFARITAALKMKVENLRPQGAAWQLGLHEKCGRRHTMPCHYALAETLRADIEAAGIAADRKGWLFRTACGHTATARLVDADRARHHT
jgi:hypothetical protein